MRLFFSCASDTTQMDVFEKYFRDTGKKVNILTSDYYWNNNARVIEIINSVVDKFTIIDSGAFTVWQSGKTIQIEKYIESVGTINEQLKGKIIAINLDMIPGKVGYFPTEQEGIEASNVSYDNYIRIKKETGVEIMPVFHQYDDYKFLEMYIKDDSHVIGIASNNNRTNLGRKPFYDKLFSFVRDKKRCHGLAVTGMPLLERYPWYSVDSASWVVCPAFGKTIKFSNGKTMQLDLNKKCDLKRMDMGDRSDCFNYHGTKGLKQVRLNRRIMWVREQQAMQDYVNDLWLKRGIDFESDDISFA